MKAVHLICAPPSLLWQDKYGVYDDAYIGVFIKDVHRKVQKYFIKNIVNC